MFQLLWRFVVGRVIKIKKIGNEAKGNRQIQLFLGCIPVVNYNDYEFRNTSERAQT